MFLISPSTSSRTDLIVSSSFASTFNRSSGSVFDGRRLNHQVGVVTVRPSRVSVVAFSREVKAVLTSAVRAVWSSTVELISPEAA